MMCKLFFCSALLLMSLASEAQKVSAKAADTSRINELLREAKAVLGQNPAEGLKKATEIRALAEKLNYPVGTASAAKLMGNATYYLGEPENALLLWQEALKIFESAGDKVGQADLLGNIGIFYYHRGDEIKALDHHLQSLKIAESINHKTAVASALINIGGVYFMKDATHGKALDYYLKALPICEELGNQTNIGAITVNIGNIYLERGEEEKAREAFQKSLKAYADVPLQIPHVYIALGELYLRRAGFQEALQQFEMALTAASKTNNQNNIARALIGKAKVYSKKGDYKTAIIHFKKAEKIARAINAVLEFEGLYEEMATAYAKTGDYTNAYKSHEVFSKVKDTIYNIETDRKLATLQFDFDLEKKQNEINLLTKDKSIKELQLKRQSTFNNAMIIVLGLIVVVVLVMYRSYRIKAKANVMLDRKNMEIERLILNILPAEVAQELRTTGKATPRSYQQVSVMFTDFKSFTALADKMTSQELVTELGNYFMAFDNIVEKYGLEKIKTVGDAYMCAGGTPTPNDNHVYNMVKAGLEIQQYVDERNREKKAAGQPLWDIRIGIHIGPVVAGVVSRKKYAYDIWGSTVNIASRMESSGMTGRVNISAATYELVKDRYNCVYRGKIYAKNVGEIDMYLVDHELQNGSGFKMPEDAEKKEEPVRPLPTNLLQ